MRNWTRGNDKFHGDGLPHSLPGVRFLKLPEELLGRKSNHLFTNFLQMSFFAQNDSMCLLILEKIKCLYVQKIWNEFCACKIVFFRVRNLFGSLRNARQASYKNQWPDEWQRVQEFMIRARPKILRDSIAELRPWERGCGLLPSFKRHRCTTTWHILSLAGWNLAQYLLKCW